MNFTADVEPRPGGLGESGKDESSGLPDVPMPSATPSATQPHPVHSVVVTDEAARAAELLPIVYAELRRIAASYFVGERAHHTLQPTALIHEAYFKLVAGDAAFRNREHFVGVAARAMRQVLVDHARQHGAAKRGGDWLRVTLDRTEPMMTMSPESLLALHEAMEKLGAKQERLVRVVELRCFGGLTIRETAAVLGVSHTTVEDDWAFARAWLGRELAGGP